MIAHKKTAREPAIPSDYIKVSVAARQRGAYIPCKGDSLRQRHLIFENNRRGVGVYARDAHVDATNIAQNARILRCKHASGMRRINGRQQGQNRHQALRACTDVCRFKTGARSSSTASGRGRQPATLFGRPSRRQLSLPPQLMEHVHVNGSQFHQRLLPPSCAEMDSAEEKSYRKATENSRHAARKPIETRRK